MKKLFLLCAAALTLAAHAEDITLDLTTAFDVADNPIAYNTQNIWDSTYSEDWSAQMIYANGTGVFYMTHLSGGNSFEGSYWDGFTLSKVAEEGGSNPFACVAKGGLKGEGTPYIVGYYSEYTAASLGHSTNILGFNEEYYPKEIYVCQDNNTFYSLTHGDSYAKKFTAKDTLALIISGINNLYEELTSVTYYLAVDSVFNQAWTKVDLTPLGKCAALSFRMTSTDCSYGYMNTPAYFALDALTVSSESTTTAIQQTNSDQPKATKRLINGQLYIEQNNRLYTITGVAL